MEDPELVNAKIACPDCERSSGGGVSVVRQVEIILCARDEKPILFPICIVRPDVPTERFVGGNGGKAVVDANLADAFTSQVLVSIGSRTSSWS